MAELRRRTASLLRTRAFTVWAVAILAGALLMQTPLRTLIFGDSTLGGFVVVVDAGHGGEELGATAPGIVERDSNLDLAKRVQVLLERRGARVVLTRPSENRPGDDARAGLSGYTATFADLQARVAIANEAHADAFVSIHSNLFGDPNVRGLQAWYDAQRPFADENRRLATLCIESVRAALSIGGYEVPSGGAMDEAGLQDASGRDTPLLVLGPERDVLREELLDRGADPASLGLGPGDASYHTAATSMPGSLLEILFVSNEADAALLKDDTARSLIAAGIAYGIERFLLEQP